jgi:hypothetical protein
MTVKAAKWMIAVAVINRSSRVTLDSFRMEEGNEDWAWTNFPSKTKIPDSSWVLVV